MPEMKGELIVLSGAELLSLIWQAFCFHHGEERRSKGLAEFSLTAITMNGTNQSSLQNSEQSIVQPVKTDPTAPRQQSNPSHSKYAEIFATCFATILAGVFGGPWLGDWIKERTSSPGAVPPVAIHQAIIYAKILSFHDREREEKPFYTKKLHLAGNAVEKSIPVYDEALYLKTYYLKGSHANKITLEGHSSGIVDVTPIAPPSAEFDVHHYEQSGFKHLSTTFDITGRDYLMVAYHYYNGFQFNRLGRKYESDGGVHFEQPADEAIVIFDFSNIVTQKSEAPFRIKGTPTVFIKRSSEGPREPIEVSYQDGILTTKSIFQIQKGTHIFCDWEWETEQRESRAN